MKRRTLSQRPKQEHKLELLGPDISGWGGGLPGEGVGAKKFSMYPEALEEQTFWQDIRDFCRDVPVGRPKSLRKKVCVQFLPPISIHGILHILMQLQTDKMYF